MEEKVMLDEFQIIEGVVCRECGNTLPRHTVGEHLDVTHPIHVCPHEILNKRSSRISKMKEGEEE
jgi:hypothetical protein